MTVRALGLVVRRTAGTARTSSAGRLLMHGEHGSLAWRGRRAFVGLEGRPDQHATYRFRVDRRHRAVVRRRFRSVDDGVALTRPFDRVVVLAHRISVILCVVIATHFVCLVTRCRVGSSPARVRRCYSFPKAKGGKWNVNAQEKKV